MNQVEICVFLPIVEGGSAIFHQTPVSKMPALVMFAQNSYLLVSPESLAECRMKLDLLRSYNRIRERERQEMQMLNLKVVR